MDTLKIKPCKTIQLGYLLFWIIIIVVPLEILGAILSDNVSEFLFGQIVILGFVAVGLIVYLFVRVFYRSYLVFTDHEVVKYKRGKVVFKVKREHIYELGYRKMSALMVFLLPFGFFFGDPMCGVLSIRFYGADVEETRVFDSVMKIQSLSEEECARGLKEYCECFTAKEVRLICQKLDFSEIKQIGLR